MTSSSFVGRRRIAARLNASILAIAATIFTSAIISLSPEEARAQSADMGQTAPQHSVIDQNNVHLGTGLWAGQLAHLSIGSANGGFDWSQPASGPDTLTATMAFGPGGGVSVSNSGYILNANAALLTSDGNGVALGDASCSTAQSGVIYDSDISWQGCSSNASTQEPPPTVGITVFYLGRSYHFYGLWETGGTKGQFVRYSELRNSDGLNSFGCTHGSDAGHYDGCIFTAHDGTTVNFPAFIYYIVPGNHRQGPGVYQASTLVKPDGEVWTYYGSSARVPGVGWAPATSGTLFLGNNGSGYDPGLDILQRPAAIVSNRGYTFKYLWDGTSVTDVVAYNTNQENCSVTASQCSFSHNWPSAHFGYTPYDSSTKQFTLNIRDSIGTTTSYTTNFFSNYGSVPQYFTITKPSGRFIRYTYDSNYIGKGVDNYSFGGPGNIAPPDPIYTQHITSVTDGTATWNYAYQYNYVDLHQTAGPPCSYYGGCSNTYKLYYLDLQTTRTDPLGATRTVISTPIGAPLSDTDELGNTITFDVALPSEPAISQIEGTIQAQTTPSGVKTTYAYGNFMSLQSVTVAQRPGTGSGNFTTNYMYGNNCPYNNNVISMVRCNKPTAVSDPNNNETDYSYDPVHGGVLVETKPADANGVRSQLRNSYQQLSASGQAGAVWLLASTSTCMSATSSNPAACVGTPAEKVTSFAYEPNNLQLASQTDVLGDGSSRQTSSFTYDLVGNTTSVTKPSGATSYVTYDALRRKVFEIEADPDGGGPLPRPITHHVYDADGNETRTETGTGFNTDGSDFSLVRAVQRTFDPATGLLTQTSVVVP